MTLGRLGGLVAATIGPLVAGFGVALLISVIQRIRQPVRDDGLRGRYGK